MKILTGGIVVGVACAAWAYVFGFAGWYKDPALSNLFMFVILIEIGALAWGLAQTKKDGKRYGGQVLAGSLMSLIAGVLLFFNSFLFTGVVFPQYFDEVRALQEEMLAAQDLPVEQMEQMRAVFDFFQTPVVAALTGAIMTVVTGVLASLVLAAFIRNKTEQA